MRLKDAIDPLSSQSVEKNNSHLRKIRHVIALASGCAAGALRFESFLGFSFYAGIWFISCLLMITMSQSHLHNFFLNPMKDLLLNGILEALPGFVLSWSLVYTLVET